jgi:hypothetical protein
MLIGSNVMLVGSFVNRQVAGHGPSAGFLPRFWLPTLPFPS